MNETLSKLQQTVAVQRPSEFFEIEGHMHRIAAFDPSVACCYMFQQFNRLEAIEIDAAVLF